MDTSIAQAKAEATVGGILVATPLWAMLIQDISMIASAIAAVCGAIIGVHALWRLVRRSREGRR
jgi:hypothetical protein